MICLLDVNALLALGFHGHELHGRVARWVAALGVGEGFVVEAEEVQDRGVQVVRVHDAVHGTLAAGKRVGALENPRERVVIALRNQVALVVVAACAREVTSI